MARLGGKTGLGSIAAVAALALVAAGCGSSSGPSGGSSSTTAGKAGGTFTILANSAFGVADPAQNYTLEEWQLLIDTHDGLVSFAKVGGVPGTKIVPDLATSIPTPTTAARPTFQHPQGHQVLQRPGDEAERLCQDVRAAVHRARPDRVLQRHRRR
jgi:ABC-type dipeptide transport system, periplasmic component